LLIAQVFFEASAGSNFCRRYSYIPKSVKLGSSLSGKNKDCRYFKQIIEENIKTQEVLSD
jgi:hypothetical protein